jgi:hypothetical protein
VDKNTRTTAIHMRQNLKQICRHLFKIQHRCFVLVGGKNIYIIPRKKFEENLYSSKISMKRYKEENDLDWKYLYDINSKKMIRDREYPILTQQLSIVITKCFFSLFSVYTIYINGSQGLSLACIDWFPRCNIFCFSVFQDRIVHCCVLTAPL